MAWLDRSNEASPTDRGMSDVITTTRTDDEPPATRMDYCRQAACDAMVPVDLRIDQRDGYHGQLVQNDLGSTQITDIIVSPTLIRRTPQLIRRSDPGLYKVELQTRGHSLFAQDDRTALLSAGDLTICHLSRPYELTYSPRAHYSQSPGTLAQMVTLTFPPTSLPLPPDDMASLTATRIPGHAPIMGLLAPILRHLARWPAEDDVAVARRLSSTVIDLLAVGLAKVLDRTPLVPPESHRQVLMLRLRAFIEKNLGDGGLSPRTVAAAHHISVRHLQNLFADVSTKDAYTVIARAMDLIRRTGRTVTTTDEPAEPEPVRDLLIDVQTVMDGTDKLRFADVVHRLRTRWGPATAAGRRNSSPPPWSIAESRSTSAASTGSPANTSSSPTTSPPRSTPPSPRKATFPDPIAGEAPSPGQGTCLTLSPVLCPAIDLRQGRQPR